jgi:signal transduction histidine kinase
VGMHERIQLLGGRLTVESSVGSGTTVRALVPLPVED